MNVREAIFDRLEASSELSDIATGGVWFMKAPQGTNPPLVIVAKMAGTRRYAFDGPPIRNQVYLVKGVGNADDAEAIDELCLELLDNFPIVIDGSELLLSPMPEDDVSYADQQYGEDYQHEGTNYRVMTERASS